MSSSRPVSTARSLAAKTRPESCSTASLSELQLVSNGHYHVMVTNTGGGYSRWKTLALTRWRNDATCDNWGLFCYIHDLSSGHYWSTTIQGYVRGVRENGGQYTHAAVWATMAFAALGDAERAWNFVGMINPIKHAESADGVDVYKSEPYVIASDVYSCAPHAGRGGWTWYTGSAGWMYRLILESLLGLTVHSTLLRITPCIPRDWKSRIPPNASASAAAEPDS